MERKFTEIAEEVIRADDKVKLSYVVSPAAAADLRVTARYAVETWKVQQARRYLVDPEAAAKSVAGGTGALN